VEKYVNARQWVELQWNTTSMSGRANMKFLHTNENYVKKRKKKKHATESAGMSRTKSEGKLP
jgi:hypothetical protein